MRSFFSVFGMMSIVSTTLFSLPQNMEVVSGNAQMVQKEGSLLIETSDHSILQFSNFDIQSHETVHFTQPSARSTVLSRIASEHPSQILGTLTSNGQVFLINPHGVYFGKESVVEVGSIVVSTLDIKNEDFLDRKYHFQLGEKFGSILNDGLIKSTEGSIVLLAPHVENRGEIKAVLGSVLIASAEHVVIDFTGDGLMKFALEGAVDESMLNQYGLIEAEIVSMKLGRAKKTISDVVNHEGITEAEVFVEENGKIYFAPLSYIQAKKIEIEGSNLQVESSMQAQNVKLIGKTIKLEGANIDASTASEGGIVLIGGGFQGKGSIPYAKEVVMDESSVIKANALENGDGGLVVLWSEDATIFNGKIEAKGGTLSGNGGVIETSSHHNLGVSGTAHTEAPFGEIGVFLLDPDILNIAVSGSFVSSSSCDTSGTLTISSQSLTGNSSTLLLYANDIIDVQAPLNMSYLHAGIYLAGCKDTTYININTDSIKTIGGVVTLIADRINVYSSLSIITNNNTNDPGNISFTCPNGFTAPTGGSITLQAGQGTITIDGDMGTEAYPLDSLSISGKSLKMRGVRTKGSALNFNSMPVTLIGNSVIQTNGGSTSGAAVTFGSLSGYYDLTVNSGSSNITFNQSVSGLKNVSCTTTGAITTQAFSSDSLEITSKDCSLLGAIVANAGGITLSNSRSLTTTVNTTFSASEGFLQIGSVPFYANMPSIQAGSIEIQGPIYLQHDLSLDTSNAHGFIYCVNQIYCETTPYSLTLNSGSGDMIFELTIGKGFKPLKSISIVNVGSATFEDEVAAQSFSQSAGSGTTSLKRGLSVTDTLSLTGNNFNLYGVISTDGGIYVAHVGKLNIHTPFINAPEVVSFIGDTVLYTDLSLTSDLISLWGYMDGGSKNLTLISPSVTAKGIGTSSSYVGTLTIDTDLLTVQNIYSNGSLDFTQTPVDLFATPSVFKSLNGSIAFGTLTPSENDLILNAANSTINLQNAISNLGDFTIEAASSVTCKDLSVKNIDWTAGNITISNPITSSGDVQVNNTGTFSINNQVTAQGFFNQIGTGAVQINSNITTSHGVSKSQISFSAPVTLTGNVILDAGSTGVGVSLKQGVFGPYSLQTLTGSGILQFLGDIGTSGTPLSSLTTTASSIQISNAYVTSGLDFSMIPVNLYGSSVNLETSGGSLSFSQVSGSSSLTLKASSGNVAFSGNIAGLSNLSISDALNITMSGSLTINGNLSIYNQGVLSFGSTKQIQVGGSFTQNSAGTVSLGENTNFQITGNTSFTGAVSFTNASITTSNANIIFNSTVNGSGILTLNAGSIGDISCNESVTTEQFIIANARNISVKNITMTGNYDPALNFTGEEVSMGGALSSSGPGSVIIANSGLLTASSTLSIQGPFLQTGIGQVVLQNGGISVSGKSESGESILLSGIVTLANDALIQSTADNGTIVMKKSVHGAHSLEVANSLGTNSFQGDLGSLEERFTSLTVSGKNSELSNVYSQFADFSSSPITLLGSSVIDVQEGSALFSQIFGSQSLSIIAGVIDVIGSIGTSDVPLTSLQFSGDASLGTSSIFTLNDQLYQKSIASTGDLVFSTITGALTFESSLTGNGTSISCNLGSGTISIAGFVEQVSNLLITNSSQCSLGNISANELRIEGGIPFIFLNGNLNLTNLMIDGGPTYFGGTIFSEDLYIKSYGSISNLRGPVSIATTTAYLNAISGVIGSYSDPISMNVSGSIEIGADPRADFIGTLPKNPSYVASNAPCFVTLNGIYIKNCKNNNQDAEESFNSMAKTYFYLPGVYSSWESLSDDLYFISNPTYVEEPHLSIYWEPQVRPSVSVVMEIDPLPIFVDQAVEIIEKPTALEQKKNILQESNVIINLDKNPLEEQFNVEFSFRNHLILLDEKEI